MSWSKHHALSQQYAIQAEESLRISSLDQAVEFYRYAAQAETLALYALDLSKVRTLGITAVSAASLWYKAKDFSQAKRIAQYWLASERLPAFANEQLVDILSAISQDSQQKELAPLPRQDSNSLVELHFGGDFASNHQVSMRTLGKSLFYLQNAIDRAYLDVKHGNLWKYAKMDNEGYEQTKFLVQPPRKGSYIASFSSDTEMGRKIVHRLSSALEPAVEQAISFNDSNLDEGSNFKEIVKSRKAQVYQKFLTPVDYRSILDSPSEKIKRRYGDRSITKEIDQLIVPIRSKNVGVSSIEMILVSDKVVRLFFDKIISSNFHAIVARRNIGEPIIYSANLRSLDHKLLNGKIENNISNKTANIHFVEDGDFFKAMPFLGSTTPINFIGCPIIEYDAFDPNAEDVYFLDLVQEL